MKVIAWILIGFCAGYAGALGQDPLCPTGEHSSEVTLLADETDCERYYLCLEGIAHHLNCPDGQHWSVERNRCQPAVDANCHVNLVPTVIEDGSLYAGCPMDEDPNKPTQFQNPRNCGQFFKCSFGRAYLISCPLGLHWDTKANRCENPFVAKCKTGASSSTLTTDRTTTQSFTSLPTTGSTKSTSTTPTTSTSTFTTPPTSTTSTASRTSIASSTKITQNPSLPMPAPECSDQSSTRRFGIPGECKWFLQCHLGNAYRIPCRTGREWSTTANECIDAALAGCSNVADTTSTTKRTTKLSTTTTATTTTATIAVVPTTCALGIEYLSHPTDCTKFIQCDNTKAIEKVCPPGLFWSKTLTNCQWTPGDCR